MFIYLFLGVKMDYNKELFLSLNKSDKYNFVKSKINTIAKELHNIDLANEDTIYYVYSDGTIASEKGGGDYGKRIDFKIIKSECIRPSTFFNFPIQSEKSYYTYSIMTEEDCNKVRDLMDELLLQI